MIRVEPKPEPPDFDEKVRKPGLRALAELRGQAAEKRPGPRRAVKEVIGLDDIECRKARADWYQPYLQGEITFSFLARRCPFLAAEIVRQLGTPPEWRTAAR